MKFLKKLLQLIALIFLMLLAMVSIGLGGGPISSSGRKENPIEIKTDLEEEGQESSE